MNNGTPNRFPGAPPLPSCLSWSPAPVWDHSFLAAPNASHHGTQKCHPLSLSSFLLCPCFVLTQKPFFYWWLMVSGFVTLYLSFLLLSEYFLLGIEGFVCCLAAALWAQPSNHPGSQWAVGSVRADCRPAPWPTAQPVTSWVTLSSLSNSLLNFLICKRNIIETILKTKWDNIHEMLWYSVWHMYSVK